MNLRPYQKAALAQIKLRSEAGIKRQLLSAATGAGKTEIFAHLIKDQIAMGRNCLVLAHRDRLIIQAAARIAGIVGDEIGIVNANSKDWCKSCVVATIQTAGRDQLHRAPRFNVIVIDEAHRSSAPQYRKVIDALLATDGLLLGVTATPNRTDKRALIPDIYQELVYEIGMPELIDQGFLCEIIGKEIKLPIDFSKLRTAMVEGIRDYRAEDVTAAFENVGWLERITEGWLAVASERRTIIFVPPGKINGMSCGMAHSLAEYMRARGIRAAAVDGATNANEQDRIIADFTDGVIQVLVNVNIFTEGIDIPPIDCVLFARPTQSSIIYSQAIGRGTRKHPGKENCLIIDVTGITEQLAQEGQSLMTLGKILPTEEQVINQQAERKAAARRLMGKLWLKHITLRLEHDDLMIEGQIGPKDRKAVADLEEELKQILRDPHHKDPCVSRVVRPPNTELLVSDSLEIRDLDFRRLGMTFNWVISIEARQAMLKYRDAEYLITRPHPNGSYIYAEVSGKHSFEGRAATYQEAKNAVERQIAALEIRRDQAFEDPKAKWRSGPISEKQQQLMLKLNIPIPQYCSKGEASNLIANFFKKMRR